MKYLKLLEDFDFNEEDFLEDETPETEIPDEEFATFLKKNDCYDKFLKNFQIQLEEEKTPIHKFYNLNDYIKNIPREEFLQFPFYWIDTSEGEDYWDNLEGEWMDIANKDGFYG